MTDKFVDQICQLIASVRANGAYSAENFVPEIIEKARQNEKEKVLELIDKMTSVEIVAGGISDTFGYTGQEFVSKNDLHQQIKEMK